MNLVFLHTVADALRRHPKRVMGSLGALLLGTGVTAFGVAPLAPDAADLPVRSISEAIDMAQRVGAERTYFTHLTHENAHADLAAELPAGIEPARSEVAQRRQLPVPAGEDGNGCGH